MGAAWGGSEPSTKSKVVAGGLDVVTAPIQVPFFVVGGIASIPDAAHQREFRKRMALEEELAPKIENDPGIAFREHWEVKGDAYRIVFEESFSRRHVNYTLDLLESIYDKTPAMRDYLFRSKACTAEFLAGHFDEAFSMCEHGSCVRLASIVGNPNTPLPLVVKVAQSKTLPIGAVFPAQNALRIRARNTPESLEFIYDQVPVIRSDLVYMKSCTPEFLTKHFDEACDLSVHGSDYQLEGILRNPNTPLPLIEKAAQSKTISQRMVQLARIKAEESKPKPPAPAVAAPATSPSPAQAPHQP